MQAPKTRSAAICRLPGRLFFRCDFRPESLADGTRLAVSDCTNGIGFALRATFALRASNRFFFVEGVMKRILLHTLLTAGFFLLASGSAFAQRHPGWPTGPASGGSTGGHEQARQIEPGRIEQAPAIGNDVRPGEHPFYGTDRGHDNDWRYNFNDGRWWYWTPGNAWAYYNDGRWQDYSEAVPYTTNYRGPAAPVGWYWNDSQKRYYWFDGTNLTAAQQ